MGVLILGSFFPTFSGAILGSHFRLHTCPRSILESLCGGSRVARMGQRTERETRRTSRIDCRLLRGLNNYQYYFGVPYYNIV